MKAFGEAKGRLSPVMSPDQRKRLARLMAERVIAACSHLRVSVICDDREVADWSRALGVDIEWTPGLGLNGAVQETMGRAAERREERLVVVHSDLPFIPDLEPFTVASATEVKLVPDRRGMGTNVISVPTESDFRFEFGPGSFDRHRHSAEQAGLKVTVVTSERLGWDIDEPEDIRVPRHLADLSDLIGEGMLIVEDLK